jgi:hypothetical protein
MPPISPSPLLRFEVLVSPNVKREDEIARLQTAHRSAVAKAIAVRNFVKSTVLSNPELTDEEQTVGYSLKKDKDGDLVLRTHLKPTGQNRNEMSERVAIFGPDPGFKDIGFSSGLSCQGVLPTTFEDGTDRYEKVYDGIHPDSSEFTDVVDTLNLMAQQAIATGCATLEEMVETGAFSIHDLESSDAALTA